MSNWMLPHTLKVAAVRSVTALIFLLGFSAPSYAQANFYQGKTITVIVGSAPGGLYDLWGRLFARTMGKYIPGNPNMLVQNMPGAGSLVAANYLHGIAKPDGLTIGMFQTHLYLLQLVGNAEVKFDVRKLNWLGSQEKGQMMLYIRADSPYKSVDDIIKAKEPPKSAADRDRQIKPHCLPGFWRKPSERNSSECWATKAAAKLTSRWSAAK